MFSLGCGLGIELGRGLEQQRVGSDHVVDNRGFTNLLGSELSLRRQVFAVIVAQVVVGSDGQGLDTGVDEELGHDRLELGLTGLEVVTADKGLVSFRELDASGYERVRGGAVDVGASFEDRRDGEQGRGGNFFVRVLDGVCETG